MDLFQATEMQGKDGDRMNKAFEKILERLEVLIEKSYYEATEGSHNAGIRNSAYHKVNKIVQEVAEEYNGGWIPCSERLPEECIPVNVTWINRKPEPYYAKIKDVPFSATAVYCKGKWYWYSSTCVDYLSEYGKNDFDLIDKYIDIVSWQPLPEPFKECD